jgi:putative transcriptional regulator
LGHHQGVPIEPFSDFEPYGGAPPPDVLVGQLLVATPRLADPNFSRRVVLIVDHGAHGALGVVINRPGGVSVGELMAPWHPLATPPPELFTGGPVARNALIGLVRLRSHPGSGGGAPEAPPGWRLLVDDPRPVGIIDLAVDPASLEDDVVAARLFSGYAGWDSGQLEEEIEEGSWYVVAAEARDPMSADPEGLWRRVLKRQGGALALVSGFPPDPAVN